MRRKVCEIHSKKEIAKILNRSTIGRLATIGTDGYPYITPVNFVWWNDSVYFHCAHEGEKISNIMGNSKVCFEVDIPLAYLDTMFDSSRPTCHVHQFYHCVIIRGNAERVTDRKEKIDALNALMISHEGEGDFVRIKEGTPGVDLCSVIAVRVERISGKSDLGQKMGDDDRQRLAVYLKKRNLPGDQETAELMGGNDG